MFNFKINELKNNIKVGFPIHSLDKYIPSLNDYNINYLVVFNKEIITKKSFDNNNYNKYKKSVFDIISINNKLNSICEFIKSIHDNDIKKDIIKSIDYILDEYR